MLTKGPADPIGVVLNDPPHNRLSMAMVDRLEELIPELASDRELRAFFEKRKPVFTGE